MLRVQHASRAMPACRPAARTPLCKARPSLVAVRAQGESPQPSKDEDELRLEALEAATTRKKASATPRMPASAGSPGQRGAQASSSGGKSSWPEGQMFPDGWDAMNPLEKASELYMGERGFMFWANKAALSSIVILGVGWVVFRFVGPALQLYALQNDLSSPSSVF